MLSREDKGLFIDLCSMYWSRLGDVPLKLAIQKLCAGNATALNSLCDEKIIEVIDGNIFINFLSEQLNEFDDISKQNSKNAKEGWEKRRKQKEESERNATALIPQCENDAIREEEIREEEKKEEEKREKKVFSEISVPEIEKKFNFRKSLIDYGFDEKLISDWLLVRKNKKASNTETAFKAFISEIESRDCNINEMLKFCVENSWSGFKHVWVDNLNKNNLGNGTSKSNEQIFRDAVQSEIAQHDYFK
jgi:hypothetical protein